MWPKLNFYVLIHDGYADQIPAQSWCYSFFKLRPVTKSQLRPIVSYFSIVSAAKCQSIFLPVRFSLSLCISRNLPYFRRMTFFMEDTCFVFAAVSLVWFAKATRLGSTRVEITNEPLNIWICEQYHLSECQILVSNITCECLMTYHPTAIK